jgi:hypothetical protein
MALQPYSIKAASDAPGPVPHTGNPELESYLASELQRLFQKINGGDMQLISLEPLGAVPSKVRDGMICFFRENVITPQRGLYEYSGGAWAKL